MSVGLDVCDFGRVGVCECEFVHVCVKVWGMGHVCGYARVWEGLRVWGVYIYVCASM